LETLPDRPPFWQPFPQLHRGFPSGSSFTTACSIDYLSVGQKTSWTIPDGNPYNNWNDMKNSPSTSILLAVLAISALWSIISCMQYLNNTRQIRQLQGQVAGIQYRQSAFQALVADTTEYGKTHPKIDPILESIGYKRNTSGAAATTNK
jgi:hypothetical protein